MTFAESHLSTKKELVDVKEHRFGVDNVERFVHKWYFQAFLKPELWINNAKTVAIILSDSL